MELLLELVEALLEELELDEALLLELDVELEWM